MFVSLKKLDRVRIEGDSRQWVVGVTYADGRRLVYPAGSGAQAQGQQKVLTAADAGTLTLVSRNPQ